MGLELVHSSASRSEVPTVLVTDYMSIFWFVGERIPQFILYRMGNCKACGSSSEGVEIKSHRQEENQKTVETRNSIQLPGEGDDYEGRKTRSKLKANTGLTASMRFIVNKSKSIGKSVLQEAAHSGDGEILEAEQENANIVQKEIDIVNGDERDRLIIIEDIEKQAEERPQPSQQVKKRESISEKVKISVDWGSFIKLKRKNFTENYRIMKELGRGGYGTVYKVSLKSSKLQRAMKSIKKSSLINEDQKKIFVQMAILRELDHPNIVKLFEIYDWKNYYYLITEYCDGGDLFQGIRKNHKYSEKAAAEIMKQLLSAVVYLHKKFIVHRDLKPENLMFSQIDSQPVLKIIDFGTSKKIKPGKTLSKEIGTPYYVAPEVLNKCYTQKCDIWSCGIILYVILFGYPPFRGSNQRQILDNVQFGPLTFQTRKGGFNCHATDLISSDATELIKKMLQRDPAKRITALQALSSDWINRTCSEIPLSEDIYENLKNFYFKNKFKAVVLTYIASQLYSNRDKKQLQRAFQEIDIDNDGVIEREELIAAFDTHYREQSLDINNILKIVDINNSGKIDYTEFLVAASSEERLLRTARLDDAFSFFDTVHIVVIKDHSGFINIEEIQGFLAEESEEDIRQFFNEFDFNRDGKISRDEFKKILIEKTDQMN